MSQEIEYECVHCGYEGTISVDESVNHNCTKCGLALYTYFTDSDIGGVAVGRYKTVRADGLEA
jgi:predicted RNA-binding Zn-ribbon protein involved in translation (DUF1610 family)